MASGDGKQRAGKKEPMSDISDELRSEIKEAFEMFDEDKDGSIETRHLKVTMRALGFEPKKDEIKDMTHKLDRDKCGKITFEDFEYLMIKKIAEKGSRDEILKAFQLFDSDNTGKISFENLKKVAEELGESIDDEELKEMIIEADKDGDGQVDRDEFLKIMKKTCLY
ncbi:Centrin-1 [Halotydeus destructor]|nr:Centrin-1 [Halotydeus destructor]